jgi:hypothetical protein
MAALVVVHLKLGMLDKLSIRDAKECPNIFFWPWSANNVFFDACRLLSVVSVAGALNTPRPLQVFILRLH